MCVAKKNEKEREGRRVDRRIDSAAQGHLVVLKSKKRSLRLYVLREEKAQEHRGGLLLKAISSPLSLPQNKRDTKEERENNEMKRYTHSLDRNRGSLKKGEFEEESDVR